MNKKTMMAAVMAACMATLFSSCATIVSGTMATVQIDRKFTEPMKIVTTYQTYEDVVLPAEVKVDRKHLGGQPAWTGDILYQGHAKGAEQRDTKGSGTSVPRTSEYDYQNPMILKFRLQHVDFLCGETCNIQSVKQ